MRSLVPLAAAVVCLVLAGCDCGRPPIMNTFDAGCREETCDGTDENCDGVVDNNLPMLTCGMGACVRTVSSCVDGAPAQCVAGEPGVETCNGIDDDCNGEPDDNIATVTCGVGECRTTVSSCVDGVAVGCEPGLPSAERCDDKDNDCDGQVDEELPPLSCGEGACVRSAASCANGLEQSCEPGLPSTELCDGVDNNCDGQVDEALAPLTCGVGDCARTVAACVMGAGQVCSPGAAGVEVCDGRDNDCDGSLDNGLGPVSCGVGACRRTVASCVSGAPQACAPGTPTTDICDGIDNDCDGTIDDDGICNPPLVLCAGSLSGQVGVPISLTATALDLDGTIVSNQWIVAIKPNGSTALPTPINQPNTTFTPDQPGQYTLAFCARDNAGTTTCCSTTISTTQCVNPPPPPVSTACGTSWDGRPIIQFPAVQPGQKYQLTAPGNSLVLASANAGENYLRPQLRVAAGGPPPGAPTTLEVRACDASQLSCCSAPSTVTVSVVEACITPIAPTSSNIVISEYVSNGEAGQVGEAVELTNLSHCPVSLDGFHFAYRNQVSSPGSFRWMNFGPGEVVPPRGVYVAIRSQQQAPVCSASLNQATQSPGLFGLRISPLDMQGPSLDTGWFNNAGGGSSVMQVAPGAVADAGVPDFMMPIAQVAPYLGGQSSCVGVGFNAVNSCGEFMGTTTPTTTLNPNQLGRLWHPCDVLGNSAVPNCIRN